MPLPISQSSTYVLLVLVDLPQGPWAIYTYFQALALACNLLNFKSDHDSGETVTQAVYLH